MVSEEDAVTLELDRMVRDRGQIQSGDWSATIEGAGPALCCVDEVMIESGLNVTRR
jgi:hypothetical protein